MRDRIQLSCVECRRNKKKCDRVSPTCKNCEKSSKSCIYIVKASITTNNSSDKDKNLISYGDSRSTSDDSSEGQSYYLKRKASRLETKWLNLTYTLERIVDFTQIDCKMEDFLTNIDLNLYKQILGRNIKRNPLISYNRVELYNPSVNAELNRVLEILIGLSFRFSFLSPVSVETIKECYLTNGINSYLINCIAAAMLPRYIILRGNIKALDLRDNVFYLKAIYLLNSNSTPLREILVGTTFLVWLEISVGNVWSAMIHFKKISALCVENKINLLDENYPLRPRSTSDLETCEKRNTWWTCTGGEMLLSMAYHHPLILKSNPKEVHTPHHQLNFNPGPYSSTQILPNNLAFNIEPTFHETIPTFHSFALATWASQIISPLIEISQNFFKPQTSPLSQRIMLRIYREFYPKIIQPMNFIIDLQLYKANLRKEPGKYANSNMLVIVIGANILQILYFSNLSEYLDHLMEPELAQLHRDKTKDLAKSLINFLKSTLKLSSDTNPLELDLTQYYISCPLIPVLILQLIKIFLPMDTLSDREALSYFLEIMKFFSSYYQIAELYVKWCQSQIKTNGKFYFKETDNVTGPVRGLLKFFQKA